ncbi:ABC transporter ATP-binding protein [Paenibacillus sp. SC116]|uniref:ABC transporter ATP-binding protein n=1 Tax=Paenibacillus sp. SC116 TaxID=2968986 RepID=UPI00215A7505|nr:ABC transporter ATP-binding protein [Paenibacillus sp. SC116]MCR8844088.1 ABC transporter ATP-binding protein [Paenibacillus sp. SC116]
MRLDAADRRKTIISITNLTKMYDEHIAVNELSLSIEEGEIYGLLGPNGAGKSTTILMMLGLTEPTSGTVRVCGLDSVRQPIAVKKRVGYLPDDIGFYEDMTGYDNLMYTARLNRIPELEARQRVEAMLQRVGLSEAAKKKASTYSRGMRQRLGLAEVLLKKPEVIILDEPTLGLDPEGVRELLQLIKALSRDEGITVLLSSHHLHQVQQICDRVGIFVKGELLVEGDVPSLAKGLYLEEALTLEVGVKPINQELIAKLRGLPDVVRVDEQDGLLQIGCKEDISSELSRILIESGCSLFHLQMKQYGLDEIYHRYFEGGEPNAGENKRNTP